MRSGLRAAKIWAAPPPLSFPTRSTRSMPSASTKARSMAACCFMPSGWPDLISVCPIPIESGAMTRRTSDSPASWWRHWKPLSTAPWMNSATGPWPRST